MERKLTMPWGRGELDIMLPSDWRVLGTLLPREAPAMTDPGQACTEALAAPLAAAPLRSRDLASSRVLVVCDDHSRPTPVADFLPAVLAELAAAGAAQERIELLIATGVHRATTPEEASRKLGPEVAARHRWSCHNALDRSALAELGTTSRGTPVSLNRKLLEADLVVCVGAIEPHLLLGFGGGLKMIVPGCAGNETIGRNHMQGVDPEHFDFVGADAEHSPMRLDLEEAARKMDREVFIVNTALGSDGRPTRFFCGDPIAAHRAGVEFVRSLVAQELPEASDVVLTNSRPMDADLRQSAKCLGNSLQAVKPGGVMMGCVRCEGGLGEMPVPKRTLPYPALRALLRLIGKQRVLPLVERAKKGEPVEELFVGHFGLQMLRRNHLGLFSESLPADTGRKMGIARTFNRIEELVAWGRARAPRKATVWVFPYGGATYAQAPVGTEKNPMRQT